MDRVEPHPHADERTTLTEFLDYQRATILLKADGVDSAQLRQPLPTSTLTLAGLLKHLAMVEDYWLQVCFLGLPEPEPWVGAPLEEDEDWDFHSAVDDDPDYLRQLYAAASQRSRDVVEATPQLGQLSVAARSDGNHHSLRWILVHLIEETARHAGHADLVRQAIDGSTGE